MTAANKGDLHIAGVGVAEGGAYENVRISGAGKINGDMEARRMSLSGAAKINGNVKVQEAEISGAAHIAGNLDAVDVMMSGAGALGGTVRAGHIHVSGAAKVQGAVYADDLTLSGVCRLAGDVEAKQFRGKGGVRIDGRLSGDDLQIAIGGVCRLRDIAGKKVVVVGPAGTTAGQGRGSHWKINLGFDRPEARLEAQSIEGDDIYLECTRARMVRGRRVTLGPDCHIDNVEYSESLHIDPQARVGAQRYTGQAPAPPAVDTTPTTPPPGVSRCNWQVNLGNFHMSSPIKCGIGILGGAFGCAVAILVALFILVVVLPVVLSIVAAVAVPVGAVILILLVLGAILLLILAPFWLIFVLPIYAIRRMTARH